MQLLLSGWVIPNTALIPTTLKGTLKKETSQLCATVLLLCHKTILIRVSPRQPNLGQGMMEQHSQRCKLLRQTGTLFI